MEAEGLNGREDVEKWASKRKVDEIISSLIAVGVPAAPINSLREIAEDLHVKYRDMIVSLEHPKTGSLRSPNQPIKYYGVETEMRYAAPLLGQHNDEALTGLLDYDSEKISKLRESKVIS